MDNFRPREWYQDCLWVENYRAEDLGVWYRSALVHSGHDPWTLQIPQWMGRGAAQIRPGWGLERAELRAGVLLMFKDGTALIHLNKS